MMQSRSFLKHFSAIGAGTAISMLIGLLTTPVITRIVDPNDYGQMSIFTMYSGIAMIVLCLGMDQAMVRYYYDEPDDTYKRSLLFRCVRLPLYFTLAVSAVVCLLSFSSAVRFEFQPLIMALLCLYTPIQLLYRFSQLMIRLAYKSQLYAALNVLQKLSYVIIALGLIYRVEHQDFLMLILANVASFLVCLVVSLAAQTKYWNFSGGRIVALKVSDRELFRYGGPFIITLGVTSIFQAIDQIALKMFSSYSEVGVYASTMTLIHIFAIVQTTFNTLWAPMAVEHFTQDPEDRSFYQQGNSIITVVMFLIGITLILCKDVFAILLGEKYRAAASILPFLIFNPIMYTISETTVSGLVFMKKSNLQILVAVTACVANAIGNFILVPRFGGQGAAISTGLSYIVFFTMRTVLSNRYFKVDFHLKRFYLLTGVVSLYALYNTFIPFNAGTVFGYAICLVTLMTLYRETAAWGARYISNSIRELFSINRHARGREK